MKLSKVHHIAIICTDYGVSKKFYTEILGLEVIREVYRAERSSYKLDLALNGEYIIELFSFPNPRLRPSRPEAAGLRHLAFETENIQETHKYIDSYNLSPEDIRTDEFTGKKFFFVADPDDLPIEFYEQ